MIGPTTRYEFQCDTTREMKILLKLTMLKLDFCSGVVWPYAQ